MRRFSKLIAILSFALLVTGCSSNTDTSSEQEGTVSVVGDFNFINQGTSSDTMGVNPDQTNSALDEIDNSGTGRPDLSNQQEETQEGTITTTSVDVTQPSEEPAILEYISPYKDLESNQSIQLGSNVYVSLPSSILENTCGLDYFIETYRLAHTLVNEEDYASKSVVAATYQNGTCIDIANNHLYINAQGLGYWCKNIPGTLDEAMNPDIMMFNLGKLSCNAGSMTARYSQLGDKLDSEDSNLFYQAVYDVADVAGTSIQARAVLIYDKQTSAIATCLIYLNSEYCADMTANIDLLAGSVRYSTVAPDNLVSLI